MQPGRHRLKIVPKKSKRTVAKAYHRSTSSNVLGFGQQISPLAQAND